MIGAMKDFAAQHRMRSTAVMGSILLLFSWIPGGTASDSSTRWDWLTKQAGRCRNSDPVAAGRFYSEALLETQNFSACDYRVAATKEAMARFLCTQKHYEQGIDLLKGCLAEQIKCFGPLDGRVAVTVQHLGNAYLLSQQYERAKECFEREIAILKGRYNDHVLCYANIQLARALGGMRQNPQAEFHCRQAISLRERCIGSDNIALSEDFVFLGDICCSQGKFKQAEQAYTRAIGLIKQNLSSDSSELVPVLISLSKAYSGDSSFAQAERSANEAYLLCSKSSSVPLKEKLSALQRLILVFDQQRKFQQASALYDTALAIGEKEPAARKQLLSQIMERVSQLKLNGQWEAGEAACRSALRSNVELLGAEKLQLHELLGFFQIMRREWNDAEKTLAYVIDVKSKSGDPTLALSYTALGFILHNQNRAASKDTIKQSQECYARARRLLDAKFDKTGEIVWLTSYALYLKDHGKLAEAKALQDKLKALQDEHK